jgi:hypothetical protein
VWDELEEQVKLERTYLCRLVRTYKTLIEECKVMPPDDIKLAALAAMLHSFYGGIENICKRITVEMADPMPSGASWHKQLLDGMVAPTASRAAVLSAGMRDQLKASHGIPALLPQCLCVHLGLGQDEASCPCH